jgi:anti-anti-sigma regulatory factor
MNTELKKYKEVVESQKDQLSDLLKEIGLNSNYDIDIEIPEDTPLSELFVGTRIAAENLDAMSKQLKKKMAQLERDEKIIKTQSETIMELSTPVTQIWDDVLILPLIGTIDTRRAGQVIENVLNAIVEKQATVVIMDVTGVPVVDTKVSDHFLKTIEASRMLGAKVILTGLSPYYAQILVSLGVDLSDVTTKGSLQQGLELAFKLTNKHVAVGPKPKKG